MQTIARANRVYPGKVNGLIVDYVGVFRDLEKALAIYALAGAVISQWRTRPHWWRRCVIRWRKYGAFVRNRG